jgi:hypothetical protein
MKSAFFFAMNSPPTRLDSATYWNLSQRSLSRGILQHGAGGPEPEDRPAGGARAPVDRFFGRGSDTASLLLLLEAVRGKQRS